MSTKQAFCDTPPSDIWRP